MVTQKLDLVLNGLEIDWVNTDVLTPLETEIDFDYPVVVKGDRGFEMSNQKLVPAQPGGNVMVSVSDMRAAIDFNSDDIIDYYEAFVLTSTDYYAYGMAMPERSTSPGSYRYGYNGMEREETWNAEVGDYYTTEFRMLDVRIGRWLSLDPLAGQFPWQSPFAAAVFLPGNRTGPALAAAMESLVDQVDILLKDKEVNLHSTIYKFNSESIFGMAKDGLVYMASPLYNKFYAESFPSMMVEMRNSLWGPRK